MPDFFPQRPDASPKIYAYSSPNPQYAGMLKVGYTTKDVAERVRQQFPQGVRGKDYTIELEAEAIRPDGSVFTDREIHKWLVRKKFFREKHTEWFRCTIRDVQAAINAVSNRIDNEELRDQNFPMRPEQQAAVDKTVTYFRSMEGEGRTPKFLWNCKMRFGKTFAAYQLAKAMAFSRVLVLTFKPAVLSAWQEDLERHLDFEGWQFISRKTTLQFEEADPARPIVCFGSFQDFLGKGANGGVKARNEWVHTTQWDLVVFDEYHYGAWGKNAKSLFEDDDEEASIDKDMEQYDRADAYDESFLPITTNHYLFLSGTPFRALNSGEFIEEQIFNWTYSDEQRAKAAWKGADNPYTSLPQMVLMTYQLPREIREIASQGEFNEFDLNEFFATSVKSVGNRKADVKSAQFSHKKEVQQWLNLIRGSHIGSTVDDLKLGKDKPPMPFSDTRLLNVLQHTIWFLPNVAACYAMSNLLAELQNTFYHDYKILVSAGTDAGIGVEALGPVQEAMQNPLATKTITLTCGKLTTGVTVRPWTGIFMLRNLASPETYFQAAFRVQSPWVLVADDGKREIMKKVCYVFDFALNRSLRQVADYSCRLAVNGKPPTENVGEFISFLPVLAYDGSSMKQVNAEEILDLAMSGTSATLLARRWESALLVNVDNDTLKRLQANKQAMDALNSIEGFRSLNQDIATIINKSEAVKKAKKASDGTESKGEKQALSAEEKEYKSLRKKIQESLIKLATRIPIFMYLTDFREQCLKDVIRKLEPDLFKKVTGLTIEDFELLVSLGVFNDALMNDAVYKFKRYEDASLEYTGINRHADEKVGGWDTVITQEELYTVVASA